MIYKAIKTCLDRFIQINYQDVAFTAKQLFISARERANARWISFCRDNTFIISTTKKKDHQREAILRQLGIHRYQRTAIERIKSQQKHGIQQIVSSSEEQTPGTEDIRVPRVPVPDPVMGALTAKKGTADHVHNNDKDGHGIPDMFKVAVHSHALSTATWSSVCAWDRQL